MNLRSGLVVAACIVAAAGVSVTGAEPTPAKRFAALKADYDKDYAAIKKPIVDPQSGRVTGYELTGEVPADKYVPILLELGTSYDDAIASAALTMAIVTWAEDPRTPEAVELLFSRFGSSPRMAEFAREQLAHFYFGQDKHLERIVAEAKDQTAVAIALVKLGMLSDENFAGPGDRLSPQQAEERRAKALEFYRRVATDFSTSDEHWIVETAQRSIRQLQQLQAGKNAPPIDGKDLAGHPLKLSDFKGKLVVLDFWGSWCGACIGELPTLKDLAAKYSDQIVILGVMSEQRPEDAAEAVAKYAVPWQNWIDLQGAGGTSPVVKSWGVVAFPTVFVLDRQQKLRFTRLHGRQELEHAIDTLLAEKLSPQAPDTAPAPRK